MLTLRSLLLIPCLLGAVTAITLALGRTYSSVAAQDSPPVRAATAEEVRELAAKLTSLSEFQAVYELKSKKRSGRMTVGYRAPDDAFLRVESVKAESGQDGQLDCWLVGGRVVSKFSGTGKSGYLSYDMLGPMEPVERMRVALARRVNGGEDETEALTARFTLVFKPHADDAERVGVEAQLLYICEKNPVRVKWFENNKSWDGARRVGDRIEVELDDCHYAFSIETGLLLEARIGDRGTITLTELETDVETQSFEPAEPDPDSEDHSAEAERSTWKGQWHLARWLSFDSLGRADKADVLDDARFDAWREVMAEFYEEWLPHFTAPLMSERTKTVDEFLAWYAQAKEAAGTDATALEALAKDTQEWRSKFETGERESMGRQGNPLKVPEQVEVTTALGARTLEAELEIIRAVMLKQLLEPLLERFDKGVAEIDERK